MNAIDLFSAERVQAQGPGPLYVKLRRVLEYAIDSGTIGQGEALPTERDIAERAALSRVTVRKAVDDLVSDGRLIRRQGSGTFVAAPVSKVDQPLSQLTSFTEDMARRGLSTRSEWLKRGLYPPSPEEMMRLGLPVGSQVARLERLRLANDVPLAIERAAIAPEFLPDPDSVTGSLYAALERHDARPVHATQRISARNVEARDAILLGIQPGDAALYIERVSRLASGRIIEFTRSVYRGDTYDFVAELTLTKGSN